MPKSLLKIIIPLCMILGVATLWYINKPEASTSHVSTTILTASSHGNNIMDLHAKNIDLDALKALKMPIIIDFGADSCIPCKEMAPVLVKLNAEMQNRAIIKFVDVWKNPDGSKGFPVQVIPTQIIFNADGTPYVPNNVTGIKFTSYSSKETKQHIFTAHQGGLTEEQMRSILKDMGVN